MAFEKKEESGNQQTEKTAEFKVIKSFEQRYGSKNFIEVALKEAVTETGESNKFYSVSKGFYDNAGNKRYKKSFGFTATDEMKNFFVESFQKM